MGTLVMCCIAVRRRIVTVKLLFSFSHHRIAIWHSKILTENGADCYLMDSSNQHAKVGESVSRSNHNVEYIADWSFVKRHSASAARPKFVVNNWEKLCFGWSSYS